MTALRTKAVRDLWHLRGQALAIAFVIAGGIATLVMAQSTYQSLEGTRARFYGDYALADVWASAKRAPDPLAERIADCTAPIVAAANATPMPVEIATALSR